MNNIVEPNSTIRILKSELELDNLNQLTFASKAAQETYFKSLPYDEIDEATYQRQDGYVRYPLNFDEAIKYNYCMYKNENYSDKWFYAFITNIEYLSDEECKIYLDTDCFQSWQFDITYKPSFIEREMLSTANDIPGANTIPENLELGEYVYIKDRDDYYRYDPDGASRYAICVGVTTEPKDTIDLAGGDVSLNGTKLYNGIPSGISYVEVDSEDLYTFIKIYDKSGQIDAIQSIFLYPYDAYDTETHYWFRSGVTQSGGIFVGYIEPTNKAANLGNFEFIKPSLLANNYNPKNKKLFTFPYSYFNFTNNVGLTESFRYEDFTLVDNKIIFKVSCCLTPGMSIKAIPYKYKWNTSSQYDDFNDIFNDGIVGAKLPIGSWNSDVYTNWLTQNSLNVPLSIIGSGLQIGAGIALASTGAGALAGGSQIASGILGIANSVAKDYEASLTPNQARGNINCSDINFSWGSGLFSVYHLSIKEEYLRICDNFFSMYGYKTNLVKLPNLNNRSNWNYVKTINCNLIGDIPQKDLQKIKDMYNNGITLWHNPNTFLDYSQTNS